VRKIIDLQEKLFSPSRFDFEINLNSRDEIPKILIGLQHIIKTPGLRDEVFQILNEVIPPEINRNTGRTGMDVWQILVLGSLHLNCHWDFDKTAEIASEHRTVRRMLGHDENDFQKIYPVQTIIDNVSLLTPEILDRINQVVCKYGHKLAGAATEEGLRCNCDSFVVETDVDFPTDINLLFKAMVKVITIIAGICGFIGLTDWRQYQYNLKKIKKMFTKVNRLKHSSSKNQDKREERTLIIKEAYMAYLDLCESFLEKVLMTIIEIQKTGTSIIIDVKLMSLNRFMEHARRQIDQIRRRVIEGETIPHDEKIFSIFEEHTEWISKGKAGVPQELGLKVCIVRDQFGFILYHHVMQKETDDKAAVFVVKETQSRFDNIKQVSFDKGFYTPDNKKELQEMLDLVVMPKKGKLSEAEKAEEYSEEFLKARRQHPVVESSINALENHGLDKCRSHGLHGFKRYAALAVLARNIQIIGHIIQQKELNRQRRINASLK